MQLENPLGSQRGGFSLFVIPALKLPHVLCTPMFTAALFITARTWKQPRCPLADDG